jgi:peroxiredoxin
MILLVLSPVVYGATVKEGAPVPTFVLVNEKGEKENIENLLDRPTVIYFTHNACHYCTQIIAMLKRADAEYGKKKLRIMAINIMAKDQRLVKAYKEELGFTFPMFAGNRGDVLRAFKINYVPILVFVDAHGTVKMQQRKE